PPIHGSERDPEPELRSIAYLRLYFHVAVVQLQDSISHGEADAAAAGLGGEVEVEDLVANVLRNAGAVVGDANDGGTGGLTIAVASRPLFFEDDLESATHWHGLSAVLH